MPACVTDNRFFRFAMKGPQRESRQHFVMGIAADTIGTLRGHAARNAEHRVNEG